LKILRGRISCSGILLCDDDDDDDDAVVVVFEEQVWSLRTHVLIMFYCRFCSCRGCCCQEEEEEE
jgi:hypothetical protein